MGFLSGFSKVGFVENYGHNLLLKGIILSWQTRDKKIAKSLINFAKKSILG